MGDGRNIAGVRPIPALEPEDADVQALISDIEDAGYEVNRHPEEDLWTVEVDYDESEEI